ncbi:hypothetical protein VAPA_2c05280 [Variovorax paradoxus B4]|uniref:Uncharacterized protein n=1 Tax=Variovorax paradoxus B4 TaxID=1246301 RepID=T1XKJ3_VARPD|nr:hypothetical protein VAPA_2c05280 [Variovorax paradoxus B4]
MTAAAERPGLASNRHIKLLRYQPRSGGRSRPFGAIWKQEGRIRWISPIIREHDDAVDAKLFVDWFPEAIYDFDQFAAAVAWLQWVCSRVQELPDVAQACRAEESLGLNCIQYAGPEDGADLAALLDGGSQARLPDIGMLRTIVNLTLKHLLQVHPVLRGLALEIAAADSAECARLTLSDGRLVRIYLDRDTHASEVVPQLLAESGRRFHRRLDSEISFFVFAQLRSALPLRLNASVLATGMRQPHIANGLVRLVWSTPLA